MSKKQLLEETTVRKFMKLANLENLSDRFVNESLGYEKEDELEEEAGQGVSKKYQRSEMDSQEEAEEMDLGGDDEDMDMELDAGDEDSDMDLDMDMDMDSSADEGSVSPEVAKKVVQAVLDALGVQGTVEDDEEGDLDVDMDDEEGDLDMDSEESDFDSEESEDSEESDDSDEDEYEEQELNEESEEDEEDDEEDDEDEQQELQESRKQLVDNVLKRVTARLVQEAKTKSKKDVRKKMQEKKKKVEEAKHHIASHKKEVGGLANKGKVKDKLYSKHEDMQYTEVKKGGKGGGKGGHEMKPQKASGGHTKTHKKTSSVVSKGKNKHR